MPSNRRGLLLSAAMLSAISSVGLAGVRVFVEGTESRVGLVLAVAAVGFGVATALAWRDRLSAAAFGIPAVALATLTTMALVEGGLFSESLLWMPSVPLVAAFLLGGRGAVGFGAAASLAILLLGLVPLGLAPTVLSEVASETVLFRAAASIGATVFGGALGLSYELHRSRAARELELEEARVAALLAGVPDAVLRLDAACGVVDARPPLGQKEHPLAKDPGRPLDESLGAAGAEAIRDAVAAAASTGGMTTASFDTGSRELEARVVAQPDNTFVVVVRDVTVLRAAEYAKRTFVAAISHELRTPLTSIAGALRLLTGGVIDATSPRGVDLLVLAQRNTTRLTRVLSDVLDLSQLAGHELAVDTRSCELTPLVREVLSAVGGPFELDERRTGVRVEADPDRFKQVLTYVCENALAHSASKDSVLVVIDADESDAIVSVEDRGRGIDESNRDRVFEPFTQLDASDTREQGGVGLGLTVARALLERMRGSMRLESKVGQGACFTAVVPLARATRPPRPPL